MQISVLETRVLCLLQQYTPFTVVTVKLIKKGESRNCCGENFSTRCDACTLGVDLKRVDPQHQRPPPPPGVEALARLLCFFFFVFNTECMIAVG